MRAFYRTSVDVLPDGCSFLPRGRRLATSPTGTSRKTDAGSLLEGRGSAAEVLTFPRLHTGFDIVYRVSCIVWVGSMLSCIMWVGSIWPECFGTHLHRNLSPTMITNCNSFLLIGAIISVLFSSLV